MAVLKVLTSGAAIPRVSPSVTNVSVQNKRLEAAVSKPSTSGQFLGAMFSGLFNCNINITPNNFVVNMQQKTTELYVDENSEEFDQLARSCPDF